MSATRVGSLVKGGNASAAQPGTIARDTATLTGDLIVVRFFVRLNKDTPLISPPDGTWTRVAGTNTGPPNTGLTFPAGTNSTTGNIQTFYKIATTDGAQSYSFTFDTTCPHVWSCRTYRGAGTPTVLGSNNATSSQSPATAAIADSGADGVLVERMIAGDVAAGSTAMTGAALTWDGAVTKDGDQQGSAGTGLCWASWGHEDGPTPHGSVAARTVTLTNAPTNSATLTLGIPASGGGGAVAPTNTTVPVITTDGSPETGETVTSDTGTWANTPTSYAYQWKRNGANIGGATASSYTLVSGDVGQSVTVTVTASNTAGSASATSAAITPSAAPPVSPPVNTVAPVITGTLAAGTAATCSTGTWTGSPTGYTYQWLRSGVAISGATSASYTLTALDVGASKVSCSVTATNSGGSVTANAPSVTVTQAVGNFAVTRYRVT